MKRKHGSLCIILTICLLMGMIPMTTFAEDTKYDLWVGGVQVTDANKDIIVEKINEISADAAKGNATFDPATNTLMLNGFSYKGEGYTFNDESAAIYSKLDTLNITAKGNNSLTHKATADHESYGIYTKGNLVITEARTGALTAKGGATNKRSIGIYLYDGNFTVSGGIISGEGDDADELSTGIWCFSGNVIVNEKTELTGIGGDSPTTRGICVARKAVINGGIITGSGGTGTKSSHGISTGSFESNSENTQITGTAGVANESAGIYIWDASTFSNGSMKGVSNASSNNESYGIFMDNDPTDTLTIAGGTVIGQGLTGAFNKAPVIAPTFIDAGVWYGDGETGAAASGVKHRSDLASRYGQKYVHIAPAPLFDASVSTVSLSLTEGTIHKDPKAKLTASYVSANNPNNSSVSYGYRWYSCDENGNNRTAVDDGDNINNEYHISEELLPGTYHYVCEVSGYDYGNNFVASVSTDVVTVKVGAGTPVVIFDPDFGSFAEIGSVIIELPISNGKLTGNVPKPAAEGYVFKGWYTKDGERISDPANHTFNHTTRLYARYSKIYTATFDANGGTFSDGRSKCSVEFTDDALDKDKVPADPTRKGREFLGWYYKNDEGNEHKLELLPGQDYYELIGDFYFYAKWSAALPMPPASDNNTPESTPVPDDSSDTGDSSQMSLWLGFMMISLVGITAYIIAWRRKTTK